VHLFTEHLAAEYAAARATPAGTRERAHRGMCIGSATRDKDLLLAAASKFQRRRASVTPSATGSMQSVIRSSPARLDEAMND
jgi:hypothetical protein